MINLNITIPDYVNYKDIKKGYFFFWGDDLYFQPHEGGETPIMWNKELKRFNIVSIMHNDARCAIPKLVSVTYAETNTNSPIKFKDVLIGDAFSTLDTKYFFIKTSSTKAVTFMVDAETGHEVGDTAIFKEDEEIGPCNVEMEIEL